jgi:HEAT repeat protein
MIQFFRNFQLDRNSFWFGFVAGALLTWILSRLRVYIPGLIKIIKQTITSARESLSTGIEQRYRLDVVRHTQKQHLTSMLFSLDEVAIESTIMVPPAQISFDNQSIPIDTVNLTIPFIPDWPELGATYQTPVISVFEALQGGANLAIAGVPGSGKSFALAQIASKVARREPGLGNLSDRVPILIHAVDINYQQPAPQSSDQPADNPQAEKKTKTPLDLIVDITSRQVSTLTLPRLPAMIQTAFLEKRALLLIDGLDELSPTEATKTTQFIQDLLNQYPHTRIIAAVSFYNFAQLPSLGFHICAMSIWGDREKTAFINKWAKLWEKLPITSDQKAVSGINSEFLNSWLSVHNTPTTPLETTLKVWAAYSGDILSADLHHSIEAYLRRLTIGREKFRSALESLALKMLIDMSPAVVPEQFEVFGTTDDETRLVEVSSDREETERPIIETSKITNISSISSFLGTTLLQSDSASRWRFSSPVIAGYLAGEALGKLGGLPKIQEQPTWSGKAIAIGFMAIFGDILPAIQSFYKQDDFLRREQLCVARYLQLAPKNTPWRSLVLRTLVTALNKEKDTLSLCARIATAIALSKDPGAVMLFKQLMRSDNQNLRLVSALGCGLIGDPKTSDDLAALINDRSPDVIRAVCLSLVEIGDKHSLEIVADALLSGNDHMRRAAAEALANHPMEGHPALQEGSTMDDLAVRRSVIYGLMRVREPWAIKIIERMQLEEKEWIVRNAAIQAIEEINRTGAYVPKQIPDLTEMPWLNDYATKQGVGVAPGRPAYELVLQALKNGSDEEKLHALDYLRYFGDEEAISLIYSWYFGGRGEIRDAAYITLWTLANAGVKLPSPVQFGF